VKAGNSGGARRQAEVVRNPSRRLGRMNGCDDFQAAASAFTLKHVEQETSFHQLGPRVIALSCRRINYSAPFVSQYF
jgi:hypothetical protein